VGFLFCGLVCNALVRPVHTRHLIEEGTTMSRGEPVAGGGGSAGIGWKGTLGALVAWVAVGIPFAWGVWSTLVKAVALFS
jgi:hypothetical protein